MLEKKIFDESSGPAQDEEDPLLPEPGNTCNGERLSSSSSTASHNSFQPPIKSTGTKSQHESPSLLEIGTSSSSRSRSRSSPLNTSTEDVILEEPAADQTFRPNPARDKNSPNTDAYNSYCLNVHEDELILPPPLNDLPIIPVMVMSPSDIDSVFEECKSVAHPLQEQPARNNCKRPTRMAFKSLEIHGTGNDDVGFPAELRNGDLPGGIPRQPRRRHRSDAGPLPMKPKRKQLVHPQPLPFSVVNEMRQMEQDPLSSVPSPLKHESMLFNLELTPHKEDRHILEDCNLDTDEISIEIPPSTENREMSSILEPVEFHAARVTDSDVRICDDDEPETNPCSGISSPIGNLHEDSVNENENLLPFASLLSLSSNEDRPTIENIYQSSAYFPEPGNGNDMKENLEPISQQDSETCCQPNATNLRAERLGIPPIMQTEKEVEYDTVWVAPDGGWGWWVLFGSIVVNILIPGTVKSFGVLFIEFIEAFQATPSTAAWIPALSYWLYSSTGPFASALAARYSFRTVTIVGGVLASAGLCISYFATSITYLYISYGVIGGLGAGLAYPIGVFIIASYFDKRRGLANGLCTSGSALGSVLVPPLLRVLLEQYGYRKAILIMGLILLNVCLAALFYDPVEKHLKKKLVLRESTTNTAPTNANTPAVEVGPRVNRNPVSSLVNISNNNMSPNRSSHACREIAASMPIAIPVPHFEQRDVRDRRGSGSNRRATFQIGHGTPQEESWSLRSTDGASPLASRFQKEETGSSPRASFMLRPRPNPYSLESNPDTETLYTGSHLISSSGAVSTVQSAAASRSRLNLTAIPEDEDYTPSESGSRNMDWSFYRDLPVAKQRLLRLSITNGSQLLGRPSSATALNQQGHVVVGNSGLARTMSVASNVSTSSFHYVSTIHHGSLLTAMQYDKTLPEFASTLTLKSVGDSCWKCCWDFPKSLLQKCGLCSKGKKRDGTDQADRVTPRRRPESTHIFDFDLLRDGFFLIMLLSTCTTAVGYTNFIIMLPSYAIKMGFDKSKSSMLLSVVAGLDFVGRIGGAALSDLQFIQRKWFFIVGLLMSGVALSLLPLATTYTSLVIYCCCFGLASGTYIGVTAVILADQLGPDKLGSSYGITLFVNGLLQLAGPPICGLLYERLGRYEPIFVGLGVTLIAGASIWVFTPFIERRRRRKLLLQVLANEQLQVVEVVPLLAATEPSAVVIGDANSKISKSDEGTSVAAALNLKNKDSVPSVV